MIARAGVSQPLGRFGRGKRADLELGQAAARRERLMVLSVTTVKLTYSARTSVLEWIFLVFSP